MIVNCQFLTLISKVYEKIQRYILHTNKGLLMILGKVTGTVVATQKDEKLVGSKLLIVQDVNLDGDLERTYTVAVDAVGAGIGEIVLIATGSSARQTNVTSNKPVDGVVMAIVDTIEIDGEVRYMK